MIASGRVVLGDNLDVLRGLPDECIDLIYVDPPFNTGRRQTLEQIRTIRDEDNGDRTGFKGQRYRTLRIGTSSISTCTMTISRFSSPDCSSFGEC